MLQRPIHRTPDSIKSLEDRLSRKENTLRILLQEQEQLSTRIRTSPDYLTMSLAQQKATKTLAEERSRCQESISRLRDKLVDVQEELRANELVCEVCDRRMQETAGEAEYQLPATGLLVRELVRDIYTLVMLFVTSM